MTVKVVFIGQLKRWAGKREVEGELPEGSTVGMLVKKVSALCGATFAQHIFFRPEAFTSGKANT
ncbi:MAG: hypothetical protein QF619_02345 [Candidatus Binatia bacterium]|jgi:molybdopterin converting factor small subunit|nr:hypothetical protein [Dehalococcoidia bacterium]MDP6558970.1 hypothetical protein [Candidatus Binatia bacterium]|tara:strand:- start:326 stop:517 length:192 start_codon:yes stop_codon:yes gene_type:complete